MTNSPFGSSGFRSRSNTRPVPKEATLRDFGAGLNVVDSDTSLTTNSSKVLKNMNRDIDGGMSVRWGTRLLADINGLSDGSIIEIAAFGGAFLCFMDNGEIVQVSLDGGSSNLIWDQTIASGLPGSPTGWSTDLVIIDYTDFKNQLVVTNGVDKPIIIDDEFAVTYLQDIPTGSNVYVPVAKYCTTVGNYVVMAGIPGYEDEIYISATGTSGTWPGDDPPNDAVSINVATYAPQANSVIRGISSFRNFLLVHFASLTVPIQLGTFDGDGNHTPTVQDVVPNYGLLSHRMVTPLAQELIFADERGVYSAKRNIFGGAIEAGFLSRNITPLWASKTIRVGEDLSLQQTSFSVYNPLEQRIMFFIKSSGVTQVFVFSFTDGLKKAAWSIYEDMEYTCGCTTLQNKVLLARGSKIYQYGNSIFEDENYTADEVDDVSPFTDVWVTATNYVVGDRVIVISMGNGRYECMVDHTSGVFATDLAAGRWRQYIGVPITFDWEMPWADINARMSKKRLTHMHFDAAGDGEFTFEVFTDKNNDSPDLSMSLVGEDNTEGLRRTIDERLWGFPVEFKLVKLRIRGSDRKRLKFETITILYNKGTYHR